MAANNQISAVGEASTSWYQIVEGPGLEQGDLLPNLTTHRVVFDESAPQGIRVLVRRGDFVVLSQTCDLEHDKVHDVLLVNLHTYQHLAQEQESARRTAFREALIHGSDIAYFLLHDFAGPPSLEWSVANFHQLRLVDKDSCQSQAVQMGPRLRLAPPYKEHLAQCFGRYMMRVALPKTAHTFKAVKYVPTVRGQ